MQSINPFFQPVPTATGAARPKRDRVRYAKLPLAPITGSPVPHLTSLYYDDEAGPYGDRGYPGNCGGNLIKDLLRFYKPKSVFDPLTGSGTCADVCKELGIYCHSSDLHQGVDACDARQFPRACFEFAWIHPPYFRMKSYTNDPRDLSRARRWKRSSNATGCSSRIALGRCCRAANWRF